MAEPRSQYEARVSARVRLHAEELMAEWRRSGRDDRRIENIVRSVVLDAYVSGARDAETLLWALTVWASGGQENSYFQRDVDAANAYLNARGLTDPGEMRDRLGELSGSES